MSGVVNRVCGMAQTWSKLLIAGGGISLLVGIVWTQHVDIVKTENKLLIIADEKEKWRAQYDHLVEETRDIENANAELRGIVSELEGAIRHLVMDGSPNVSDEALKLQAEIDRLVKENQTPKDGSTGGLQERASPVSNVRVEFVSVSEQSGRGERLGNMAGRIVGLDHPERYKAVIYTQTDHWYAQPLVTGYITDIGEDGTWSNWVHLGRQYAVLVIDPSYRPPVATDVLPVVGGPVLAKTVKLATGG